MRTPMIVAALAATAALAPALAQTNPAAPTQPLPYDRGYDKDTPRTEAVNAQEAPVTAGLNNQAGAAAATSSGTTVAAQAQYDADRQAYLDALVKHDAAVNRTDARYMRQQRAYADAMAVWRVQVQECKRGHQRACDLPPPNVSDYY